MSGAWTAEIERRLAPGFVVRAALGGPAGGFSALALFGPSGSGKTTILRALAGLDRLDAGRIDVDGVPWADASRGFHLPAARRRVGYVAQDDDLFPHLTAAENVAFGLAALPRAERAREAAAWLERFALGGLGGRRPRDLSGGQRRRVALARAAARRPALLLLDEPFAALDAATRAAVRRSLRGELKACGAPVVLVTHDADEALAFADEAALVDGGAVVQRGPVAEVFSRPNGAAAARVVGAETVVAGEVLACEGGFATVRVGTAVLRALAEDAAPGPALVCVRADCVLLERAAGATSARNALPARVVEVAPAGAMVRVTLDAGFPLAALVTRAACEDLGGRARRRAVRPREGAARARRAARLRPPAAGRGAGPRRGAPGYWLTSYAIARVVLADGVNGGSVAGLSKFDSYDQLRVGA